MTIGRARRASCVAALAWLVPALCNADPAFEVSGRIYLSAAADHVVDHLQAVPFQPFDVYLLVDFEDPASVPSMRMLEARLRFDSSIAFNSAEWLGSAHQAQLAISPGNLQFIEGWDPCRIATAGPVAVARFVALLMAPTSDALIGVEAFEGGSFNGLGPGWHSCSEPSSHLFEGSPGAWSHLAVNSTVPVPDQSWGTLKIQHGAVQR